MDNFRDYFTRENLVRSLDKTNYVPGRLGELGLFETVPLTSTTFAIEEAALNTGKIMTVIPRGGVRERSSLNKRKVHTFTTESYGDQGSVYADEVLNARGAGVTGAAEVLQYRRDQTVSVLRETADLTFESKRMACLVSPSSSEFGSAPAAVTIAVQTDATKVRQEIFNKLVKPIESALKGIRYTGIRVLCEDGFWAELIENDQIRKTYLNWQAAAELRGDTTESFAYGNVMWERYRGTSDINITSNRAIAFPVGVKGLFFQGFAPNDTLESVGQGALGQPYYLGSSEIKDSQGIKGWEISLQSHFKMICGRPAAIQTIKLS